LKVLSDKFGIDVCGEKGECHTMIIDAPIFKKTIDVSNFSKERKDNLLFIKINKASLKQRTDKK
jgi:diphthamide synthase (EF-2-diphthine--ammonia ligase)